MDLLNIRTKVITEINLIPEDKLEELYNFIHYWRLNGESSPGSLEQTMQFAGCWNDMSDETFANFSEEINIRRQQAFFERRSDETSFD
ncbi:hypothetical protein PN480_04735 [Dolichospermum circinale CS-1225]|jgi:hypothetical protein|uniref:DUF2281 domain-containing protein n=4 Tax=Dolichospermum TaxID=748770 RepID=A0A6H2C3M4_DOLFA|nr:MULTISPECIES: hypothetical protein [Nostocales]MBJ7298697.1 hypothetical protein [Dolichospermum sp.]MBS9383678.1 hypothetical protein [Dolichospermum sp. BR01]MBS9388035.1 hypothetical protein [Dolichospermum sp. WA123]MBS9394310.1 hypothetical protein [Dolichospermum sp. OL01]MCE2697956.1 hypothetical protein [Anabaena sp. 49633_E8]MCO5797940.1 hypothetical protein [Dolichospermum sp. OL03]MDJ0502667.1 hypothetical protein [Nostocales cyanobacterium LE14-WE4]OBQ05050.1 MAG: hypothetica